MRRNKLTTEMVDWLVPHQANKRIIEATAERMGLSADHVMVTIHKYGNTTAATIPLCLWDYEKKLKAGDRLILAAFGGGFTWGGIYLTWAYGPRSPRVTQSVGGRCSSSATKGISREAVIQSAIVRRALISLGPMASSASRNATRYEPGPVAFSAAISPAMP